MGYRRQPKIYKLVFQGEFEGLIVQANGLPMGAFLELAKMYDLAEDGSSMEAVERIFTLFAERLVYWNLEAEDGTPVPPTVEGMKTQDLSFVMTLISEWIEAMSGVSEELGKASPAGGTFPEVPLPMVPLS